MKYKPGTILKAADAYETFYFVGGFKPKDMRVEGEWSEVSGDMVVMVLATPPVSDAINPEHRYYYELLAGDKHAHHHKSVIEDQSRWIEVKEDKE